MISGLDRIIESANLDDQPLTVALTSAPSQVVERGSLILLVDDATLVERALRHYPGSHPVRVLNETGELFITTVVDAPDRGIRVGDALIVEAVPAHELRHAPEGLRGVIDRLRDPVDGCPWDNEQTHESLRRHLLEETYEVLEAIESGDPSELCEELGDLMMQVVLHAKLAEQAGAFTLDDVSEGIRAKLVRRHPHVFGDATADTPKLVEGAWERLKAEERPHRESVLDGVPKALPALARAQSILGRAERNGFARPAKAAQTLGERLLDLVQEAREHDVSAEDALRDALAQFEAEVRRREAATRG